MEMLDGLMENYFYMVAIILFIIGMHTMLTHSNLVKKVIAMNIMDTSVFLLFVAVGYVHGGAPPLLDSAADVYVNPLPSVLILTGIIVALSVTAFALSLITKIYEYYGTVDADEIADLRDTN